MLTQWYERCSRYYSIAAIEDEKRLTMMLFQKIFDALASRVCSKDFFIAEKVIRGFRLGL